MQSYVGPTLRQVASFRLPTRWGWFRAMGFERELHGTTESALVLSQGELTRGAPLLRLHSQCVTGEVFGSSRCDCAAQLDFAMKAIAAERRGAVIYDDREGRGIGLMAKLRAYELQDAGHDTVSANLALGYRADHRDFGLPAQVAHELGIRSVRLISNNPAKARAISEAGIEIAARIPCEVPPTRESLAYLRTKKERMGHLLDLHPLDRAKR